MSFASRSFVLAVLAVFVIQPLLAPGLGTADPDLPCPDPVHVEAVGVVCVLPGGLGYVGLLADGSTFTTHGPDPIPDGGDVLPASTQEREPRCATDWYQHVLYAYPANGANRYSDVVETIRTQIRKMNWVLNEDALESGDVTADYKVLCDGAGRIRVDAFVVPSSSADFDAVVNAAKSAGFRGNAADYTIFYDQTHSAYCGVGHMAIDDSPGQFNANNRGNHYGVTYRSCWTGRTPMHENGHNQGAVQFTAPMSDGSGHCLEGQDIMCYPTSSFLELCRDRVHFDCNHDTYFNTAPASGSYLATHWNIGSRANHFIAFGDTDPPPTNLPPVASFDLVLEDRNVTVDASASADSDGDALSFTWSFGDGNTSTGVVATHTYARAGHHEIRLTVRDGNGGVDVATSTILIPVVVAPRIESVAFSGHIVCGLGWGPFSTVDLCAGEEANTIFEFPHDEGLSGLYTVLEWSPGELPAEELSYFYSRPFRVDAGSGTSPVVGSDEIAAGSSAALYGGSVMVEVRPSGDSGLVLEQPFSLCVWTLYGGAALPEPKPTTCRPEDA